MSKVKVDSALKLLIGLLLGAFVWVIYAGIHEQVIVVGDTAPSFSITADNGRTISATNFGGRLLVLNFWASWCPPCVQETPSLDQFARAMQDKGVVVLAVSVDKDPSAYQQFLQKARVGFLTARDGGARINADFGTFKYPETYIINPQGKVVQKIVGPTDWTDPSMVKYVQSLL